MLYLCQIFCIIASFIPYFIYEERKNSKKNNKENTLKGKVTDFLQENYVISMRKLPTFFSWWIYLHATSSLFVLPNPMSFVSKLYDFFVSTLTAPSTSVRVLER